MELPIRRERAPSGDRDAVVPALAIVGAAAVLLIPAIVNGFPFVYSDTGMYLHAAIDRVVPLDRPVFYSVFATLLDLKLSPWPIVVTQAIIVAVAIHAVGLRLFGIRNPWAVFFIAILLAATSSLPWFVGWIMPDIFTSLIFLSLLLIAMSWERMTVPERLGAALLLAASVTFHFGNLPIALAALPIFATLAALGWRPATAAWARFAAMAAAVAIAAAAMIFSNVVGNGRAVISPGASTFLLAKLLQDGPALAVLQSECPAMRWKLCAELGDLEEHRRAIQRHEAADGLTDYFLWGGPAARLGWINSVEPEAAEVVVKVVRSDPWGVAGMALTGMARQFLSFSTGGSLEPFATDEQPVPTMRRIFGEATAASFLASRQGRNALEFDRLNAIQTVTIILSAAVLLAAAALSWRGDRRLLYIVVALAIFLMANALVTGALSGVHDRYQARVIWLVPLFAYFVVLRRLDMFRRTPQGAKALP